MVVVKSAARRALPSPGPVRPARPVRPVRPDTASVMDLIGVVQHETHPPLFEFLTALVMTLQIDDAFLSEEPLTYV